MLMRELSVSARLHAQHVFKGCLHICASLQACRNVQRELMWNVCMPVTMHNMFMILWMGVTSQAVEEAPVCVRDGKSGELRW